MTATGTRRYQIGRDETNDIVIRHASVSRVHAILDELGGGQYLLTDLNSTYGSGIEQDGNWMQVQKAVVAKDDQVRLGDETVAVAKLLALTGTETPGAEAGRAKTVHASVRRRGPMPLLAGVAAAFLLLAVGAWFLLDSKSSPQETIVALCVAGGSKTSTCRCRARVLDARLTERELKTYAAHMRDRMAMPVQLIAKVIPASGSLRACNRQ